MVKRLKRVLSGAWSHKLQKILSNLHNRKVPIKITFPKDHQPYVGGRESLEAYCISVRQGERDVELILDRYLAESDHLLVTGKKAYYVHKEIWLPVSVNVAPSGSARRLAKPPAPQMSLCA